MLPIDRDETDLVRQRFAFELEQPVDLTVFGRWASYPLGPGADYSRLAVQLAREVAACSSLVTLRHHDLFREPELAVAAGVVCAPTVVVRGPSGDRVRFVGAPAGYLWPTLVEAVVDASRGRPLLRPPSLAALSALTQPLHIQVFTGPETPNGPRLVRLAHQVALASALVRAEMVDAAPFPELARRARVGRLPALALDGRVISTAALPEAAFVRLVLAAAGAPAPAWGTRTLRS